MQHFSVWYALLAVAGGALVHGGIVFLGHVLRDVERQRFEKMINETAAKTLANKTTAENDAPYSTLDELPPGEYEILKR